MDEESIAEALERKLKVKPGSLLFVQTTTPMKKLPRLCSRFRCFTRDSVWTDRSDEVSLTNSVDQTMRSSLAAHGDNHCGRIARLLGILNKKVTSIYRHRIATAHH